MSTWHLQIQQQLHGTQYRASQIETLKTNTTHLHCARGSSGSLTGLQEACERPPRDAQTALRRLNSSLQRCNQQVDNLRTSSWGWGPAECMERLNNTVEILMASESAPSLHLSLWLYFACHFFAMPFYLVAGRPLKLEQPTKTSAALWASDIRMAARDRNRSSVTRTMGSRNKGFQRCVLPKTCGVWPRNLHMMCVEPIDVLYESPT